MKIGAFTFPVMGEISLEGDPSREEVLEPPGELRVGEWKSSRNTNIVISTIWFNPCR